MENKQKTPKAKNVFLFFLVITLEYVGGWGEGGGHQPTNME